MFYYHGSDKSMLAVDVIVVQSAQSVRKQTNTNKKSIIENLKRKQIYI